MVHPPEDIFKRGSLYKGFSTSVDIVNATLHNKERPKGEEGECVPKQLADEPALTMHSMGLCKYATAPPMTECFVNALGFRMMVKNAGGITVLDVIDRVRSL